MSAKNELKIAAIFSSLLLIFISVLVFYSDGSYQGGDTFQHYLIAKYALKHPHLLLDHWGKPIFTLLYAIPASLGYASAKIFTCAIGVVGAYITFLCAREFKQKHSISMIVMVLFAPMYFIHLNTVMTEILFSTWLISGIYLLLKNKWMAAAVLMSFLPFVRTEGFVLLPFLSIWFLLHKRWLPFFMLASGTLLYSLIGLVFHYHQFFWIFSQNPYAIVSPYGSGQWHHFVTSNKVIWGLPIFVMMCFGLGVLLFKSIRIKQSELVKHYLILIVVPFLVFIIFHSVAWATGALASNGETRVLVCTMPLACIMAGYGLNALIAFMEQNKYSVSVVILYLSIVIITPFQFFKMPLAQDAGQQLVQKATEFIVQNYAGRKIHFVDPQVAVELEIDLYEGISGSQWFADKLHPENSMNSGEIALWDAHFAAHEGGVPFQIFSLNPNFRLLQHFQPTPPIILFENEKYTVAIFECIK